jgi:ankyrin repeat protein
VELLLARGADVNAWSRNFMTPLHNAAEEGRKEVAMVLLAAGADINAVASDHGTPLCVASGEGRREMVLLLLEKGGRLNPVTGSETTPLQRAVLNGQKQIVELLLTKGAEINAMSGGGVTPLSWAAGAGQKEVLELLLAKGADIKAKNIDGRTVLHWAAYSGTKEVVELLLVKGAEVNAADESGGTPLFRAARRGHKEIAELLVACGADVNAKDNRGGTPQQTAKAWEHKELADWFLACREADSSVRLAAVEKMVDQELLARFAQSDTEEKVRLAAINKIADQKLLIGILLKESSTVICADIIDRLDGPASEIQLSRLARDPSPSMRAVAVDRLLDSSVLRDISSKDKDWGVRSAAAKQLEYLGRCERVLNVIEKGGLWFCLWSISEGTGDDTKRTEEIILVVPAGSKTGSRIEIERRAVGISASVGVMRDLENEDRSFVVAGFEGDPSIRKLWFRFVSAAMEQKKVVAMVAVFTDGGAREGQKAPARIQMELTPEAVWRLSVR